MKPNCRIPLALLLMVAVTGKVSANVYTVTSTVDNATAGTTAGTLRWALTQANGHTGKDSIYFAILPAGNYFETVGLNSFPVIQVYDSLPGIYDALVIDGTTQPTTNLTSIPGKTVGVDALVQANFIGPNIYIVPNATFTFPNGTGSQAKSNKGAGFVIQTNDVTIKKIALSGFGNTNTSASSAQATACISVIANSTSTNSTILIQDCFLGCDPTGAYPSLSYRQTKGQGIMVQANRHNGIIRHNYIAWAGVNAINLNCAINTPASPSFPVIRGWTIEDNYMYHPSNNSALLSASNVSDAASCLGTPRLTYQRNYIEDTYQTALDLGHNGDTSIAVNNTVTGTVRTIGVLPQVGIRVTASCRAVTVQKNLIYNNSSTQFTAGIYLDGVLTSVTNASPYNSINNLITQNVIHDNQGSGIVISAMDGGTGGITSANTISQNSTYNNAGLGIDLGLVNTGASNGTTSVTINDNGDADAGANGLQNFSIIDSASRVGTTLTVWGKSPAGATLEFFTCDGGINKFPSYSLNYGEGKDYLGTGVEGSGADLAGGTASYADVDGNAGSGGGIYNKFQFSFTLSGALAASVVSTDSLTSTTTLAGSTSEFGPQAIKFTVLSADLRSFTGKYANNETRLSWNAICDNNFNYFEVQHSTDAVSFATIGKVYGDFNGNAPKDYNFTHSNPAGNSNYYRLKLIDKDGKVRYSSLVLVKLNSKLAITIGPNPASDIIFINANTSKNDNVQVKIFNAGGNLVLTHQQPVSAGANAFTIKDISRFTPGTYVVQVKTAEETATQQIVIKH